MSFHAWSVQVCEWLFVSILFDELTERWLIVGEQVVAARSVHLSYACRETVALFYNEVVVKESTPGSYFMVCGWSGGYFGIQQLEDPDDKVSLLVQSNECILCSFFCLSFCYRLYCFLLGILLMVMTLAKFLRNIGSL